MKFIYCIIIILLFSIPAFTQDEESAELETITVKSSPLDVSSDSMNRNILSITAEEIQEHGFGSFDEILDYSGLIDSRSRNTKVQSDISIRGGSFEQVLIMVDGVPVNNPQTGHHNMNLPVPMDQIERIDIIPGHTSLYGNGFSGTINIITKKKFAKNISLSGAYGSNNTIEGSGYTAFYTADGSGFTAAGSSESSDGFKHGTEYDIAKAGISGIYQFNDRNNVQFYYGYEFRDFGAYDFYTPGKNNPSHEKIESHISNLTFNSEMQKLVIRPRLYYNQANDDFILKSTNPAAYRNIHDTWKYGADLLAGYKFNKNIALSAVANWNTDRIEGYSVKGGQEGPGLGDHQRNSLSGGCEIIYSSKSYGIYCSNRTDHYFDRETYYSPNLGFHIWLTDFLKIRNSNGMSYRMPTYTDLFYNDGVSTGNDNLKAERTYSSEMGIDLFFSKFTVNNTCFYRRSKDLIDWVENSTGWQAGNINEMDFMGIENEIKFIPDESMEINIRNSYIHVKTVEEYKSKYELNNTRNQVGLNLLFRLPLAINIAADAVYKRRKDYSYILTSLYLSKGIMDHTVIFVKGDNLLNEEYEEIDGLEQPGLEIKGGMRAGF